VVKKIKIAFFTFTRAEYGLLRWSIKRVSDFFGKNVKVIVGGAHLSKNYGLTMNEIICDDINIDYHIDFLLSNNTPEALTKSLGVGIISTAQLFQVEKPDVIVILGDRYELYTAVLPAVLHNIPIIHIEGGAKTYGVIDEQIRHSITKISHVHIVSNNIHAENVSRMGEEDWRIQVLGSPGIENIYRLKLKNIDEIKEELGIDLLIPTILVTYHPVTLEKKISTERQIENLLNALRYFKDFQIIFTAPGAEVERNIIMEKIQDFVEKSKKAYLFKNLGSKLYLSVARHCKAVVGNSSSGIIEIPSLKIPTINIGDRQKGRISAKSVIHCGYEKEEIIKAIDKAVNDKEFLKVISNVKNPYDPYGDGNFSERFIKVLSNILINEKLLRKELDFEVKREQWNALLEGKI